MTAIEAITRPDFIAMLNQDHVLGFSFCRNIRTGIYLKISPERIYKYVQGFYDSHLKAHFEIEEKLIFPILGTDHEFVKKALAEHRKIARLITKTKEIEKVNSLIEEELEKHIRFEERVLFMEIQKNISEAQINLILAHHSDNKALEFTWADCFWKTDKN